MAFLNLEQTSLANASTIKTKLSAIGIGRDAEPGSFFYDTISRACYALPLNAFGMFRGVVLATNEIVDGFDSGFVRSWTQKELEVYIPLAFNGFVSITFTPVLLTWKCTLVCSGGTYEETALNKSNAGAEAFIAALNDSGSGLTPK